MYNRWKKLRIEQLIHEDIRDVAKVQEVRQMDLLSEYIIAAAGSQVSYSSLANNIRVSVDMWNDTGMGEFLLHYVRDKNQREVDFLVVKDSIPWFLVEVKSSESKKTVRLSSPGRPYCRSLYRKWYFPFKADDPGDLHESITNDQAFN